VHSSNNTAIFRQINKNTVATHHRWRSGFDTFETRVAMKPFLLISGPNKTFDG
jgi:hypothetical protein